MKKLVINNKEKHTILEMHKSMGYKSMISETMDISDVETQSVLDYVMKELNVSEPEKDKVESLGEDKLLDMIGCIPEEFENINTIEDAKNLFKNKDKVGKLSEQEYKGSEDDEKYLYAIGGLLLLGIITGIANNAKNIGRFFKRLFKKKGKCARR